MVALVSIMPLSVDAKTKVTLNFRRHHSNKHRRNKRSNTTVLEPIG